LSTRPTEFAFEIFLPGHRPIYAVFRGYAIFRRATTCGATWRRGYYQGVNVADVEGGHGHWMVDPRGTNRPTTYHHTLGSAILAAELADALDALDADDEAYGKCNAAYTTLDLLHSAIDTHRVSVSLDSTDSIVRAML
jgi:hypothetical protein